jgi:glycosyltransferase involved in cell wall biosynthesis
MNKKITLIHPYYENPRMLEAQQDTWKGFPKRWRDHFRVIVVDDGSKDTPAEDAYEEIGFEYRLYRINVDVRWNWLACRNLAASEADDDSWLFLTDIDHIVPEQALAYLYEAVLDPDCFYTPRRARFPNRVPIAKDHPNSYIMTRDLYWRIGGYDERFSGVYGTDGMYRRRSLQHAEHVILDRCVTWLHTQAEIDDASTTKYERKTDYDRRECNKRMWAIAASGDLRPHTLLFPWERVI